MSEYGPDDLLIWTEIQDYLGLGRKKIRSLEASTGIKLPLFDTYVERPWRKPNGVTSTQRCRAQALTFRGLQDWEERVFCGGNPELEALWDAEPGTIASDPNGNYIQKIGNKGRAWSDGDATLTSVYAHLLDYKVT